MFKYNIIILIQYYIIICSCILTVILYQLGSPRGSRLSLGTKPILNLLLGTGLFLPRCVPLFLPVIITCLLLLFELVAICTSSSKHASARLLGTSLAGLACVLNDTLGLLWV